MIIESSESVFLIQSSAVIKEEIATSYNPRGREQGMRGLKREDAIQANITYQSRPAVLFYHPLKSKQRLVSCKPLLAPWDAEGVIGLL